MASRPPPTHTSHSGTAHARLQWSDDGQPCSEEFGERYFSRHNGLAENRHVFLQHNRLAERWGQLRDGEAFVIGETGFGTGLNFLAAWQLWQQTAPATASLHFVSVEKFPLCATDLSRAQALWPELQSLAAELLAQYPPILIDGFHNLQFAGGRVRLTVIIGEACSGLEQLLDSPHPAHRRPRRGIDAWFLDGFTPANNPAMWRPELFALLRELSAPGATLATFTAAGVVRRGLAEHGFQLQQVDGYGHKREMLRGELSQPATLPAPESMPVNASNASHPVPWYVTPPAPLTSSRRAVVVGAGLAGCHTARALAERGWQVTLLERQGQIASEGSGNAQGVLYAKLSHRSETLSDFNLLALQFAQRHYSPFWQRATAAQGQRCGVLQLAGSEAGAHSQQQLAERFGQQTLFQWLDAAGASQVSGVNCEQGGLFFPAAGWLQPQAVCRALLQHPAIELQTGRQLRAMEYGEGEWQLALDDGSQRQSPVVVLTSATDTRLLEQAQELPLKPVRGQVTQIKADTRSLALKTVICGDGYLPPAVDGQHCLGATFAPGERDLALRDEDHRRNLDTLRRQLPALQSSLRPERVVGGRAALRCTTPDYLPLTGPLPKYQPLLQTYSLLRKNARARIPFAAPCYPGLYVNLGHGSRGLAYTPLCAELLAADIHGQLSTLGHGLQAALHPGRFWIRDLIRNRR